MLSKFLSWLQSFWPKKASPTTAPVSAPKVVVDPSVPNDEIHLRDDKGNTVGKIINVGDAVFERAFEYTILNEGGEYTDDPDDAGGPTRWGITQHDLSRFMGRQTSPAEVQALTKERVKPIYRKFYWEPLRCDEIKDPEVAICIYDQGVLRGISGITKAVQRILGKDPTGKMDEKTLLSINASDDDWMIQQIEMEAEDFYKGIVDRKPSQGKFLKGWLARAGRLLGLVDKV